MKKLFVFGSILFTLAACTKDFQETSKTTSDVVLSFTSAKPELDNVGVSTSAVTKTAWDGSKIVWSGGDKIRVGYTLDGNWMGQTEAGEAKFYASDEVAINESNASVGTFSVPITQSSFTDPKANGKYIFYAIYPSSLLTGATVSDPTNATVTLRASQNPAENSFEGATDIMVGKTAELSLEGLPTDPIELSWNRVVAHAALTFSNMAFVGTETPTKITLTFNDEAKVAGSFSVNISDGTIGAGSSNAIVLEGSGFVVDGNSINTWATVLPVSFSSLNVEIKTDKATYTRSITGLSKTFKKNARNTLTINMTEATRTAQAEYEWVKKNLSEISSSDVFVIVGNNGSNYAMSNGNGTTSAPSAVAVNVANNKLSVAPADNIQWQLSVNNGSYTFYPNGTTETWLYCTSKNNGVRVGTNEDKAFTLDDSGYLKHTATSRFIGVYDSHDWRCYTSVQTNIDGQTFSFYVKSNPDIRVEAGMSWSATSATATIEDGDIINFTAPTLTVGNATGITYESSSPAVASVSEAGAVTILAEGTTTIKAIFAGDDNYKPQTVEYSLTVTDNRTPVNPNTSTEESPYSASDAINLAQTLSSRESIENVYVSGIISRIATAFNSQFKNVTFMISADGSSTGEFEIYRMPATSANDFLVGDAVEIKGTLVNYNGSTPEITAGAELIQRLHKPTITPDGGIFSESQSVSISAESGATIKYSIDGTAPSINYSSALNLTETTTVKAIAVSGILTTGIATATFTKSSGGGEVGTEDHSATIIFGSAAGSTSVNDASVSGNDSQGNTWTITTEGTTSFTPNAGYAQIGAAKKPATSITFTTTLTSEATIKAMSAKFGGFSGTAGTITLKVGDTTIGTGTLDATNDVTINATTTNATGKVLSVTVTGISKGVKVYNINVTYNN